MPKAQYVAFDGKVFDRLGMAEDYERKKFQEWLDSGPQIYAHDFCDTLGSEARMFIFQYFLRIHST